MNSSVAQTFEVLKIIFSEPNYKLLIGNFLILFGIVIIIFYSFQLKPSESNDEGLEASSSTTTTDIAITKSESSSITKEKKATSPKNKTPDAKATTTTPKKSTRKRTTELGQLLSPDGTRSSLRLRGRTPRVFQD